MRAAVIVVVVVSASLSAVIDLSQSIACTSIYEQLPRPQVCCNSPKFLVPKAIVNGCADNCTASNDVCCFYRCVPQKSGVLVDGKVRKTRVRALFEHGIDKSAGNHTVKLWRLVVAQTTEECFHKFRFNRNLGKCVPRYYNDIINCIQLENFLHCPRFNSTEHCEDVKANLRSCNRNSTIF